MYCAPFHVHPTAHPWCKHSALHPLPSTASPEALHRCAPCAETGRDVTLEAELPSWVAAEDVRVDFGTQALAVEVEGLASWRRDYWQPRSVTSLTSVVMLFISSAYV